MYERDIRKIIQQLFLAINFMHEKGIIHRDIKPENILLESGAEMNIKLTDFGFQKFFKYNEIRRRSAAVAGSPFYQAPEIIQKKEYDAKVDVWSAGVVAHVLLTGKPPFISSSKDGLWKAIQKDDLKFEGPEWENISSVAKEFLESALTKDPASRPSARELLSHPWLQVSWLS